MPNQIDAARIRETYSNMYDDELLDFAKNEGLNISTDAFLILKNELKKRNIGADILQELEYEIILHAGLNSKRLTEDLNRSLFHEAIDFALTQKQKGASNYDIYAGLIEMGVTEEYSNYMVNKLSEWTDALHKDSKTELQAGLGILVIGIIAIYISVSIGRFQIGAALIILIGVGKIILWTTKKNQYKKILDRVREEEIVLNRYSSKPD